MDALLAHCAAAFTQHGGLFAIFFLGGLTGGFTHCLAMCGALAACGRPCASSCGRAKAVVADGFVYHAGRMTSYGALGFFAALLSRQVAAYSWWPVASSLMLAAAGVLFLLSCLNRCEHTAFSTISGSTYVRGALLGFMPCGLLYAALMMAATLESPISGMIAMWIFTLGTMPALIIASGSAALLSKKWRHAMRYAGRALMAFNGFSLLFMAAKIMR